MSTDINHTKNRALTVSILLLVVLVISLFLPSFPFFGGSQSYAQMHLLMELFAIIVSLLVFALGWNTFDERRSNEYMILACGFFGVAMIDILHALSYQGMPQLVTESSPEKAINFWLAGRTLAAVALLSVAVRYSPAVRKNFWLYLALSIVASTGWIGLFHVDWIPRTFIPGIGLTPFKIGYEYALVVAYMLSTLFFIRRAHNENAPYFFWLACACFIMVLQELFFSNYKSVSDLSNLLGHIYKIIAYFIIYRTIFVHGMRSPYKKLRTYEQTLERRVRERTAELDMANQELETFSYTVAHDLRSPLRIIDGYTSLIQTENEGKLNQDAADNLHHIRKTTKRMGELIDDLLNLAKLTLQEMQRKDFDLSALAGTAVTSLNSAHPQRNVQITIQPGMNANGDPGLMLVVMENLISNAWKFTAKTDTSRIDIGAVQRDEHTDYYVRDNGAGFDMEHAHKLFRPFQRLHSSDEFDGTGIGLATVRRIIRRHHGEVRIESALNRGTTVFFSIGKTT